VNEKMSDEKDETLKNLRDEISMLKEHLARISNKLEEVDVSEQKEETVSDEVPISPEDAELLEEKEDSSNKVDEPWDDIDKPRYSRRWKRPKRIKINHDLGDQLGEYIGGFVEDVMEGVGQELEQSLFVERRIPRDRIGGRLTQAEAKETADVMSALANEHRIRALSELSTGGMYASDLQEALSEISPSTLNSHLDVLEDAGLVLQERRRGRYLITISGRVAVKMAFQIMKRSRYKYDLDESGF
jgi:DNA-binding transcriptional ArsR family regulator